MALSTEQQWAIGDALLAAEPMGAKGGGRSGVSERRGPIARKYGISVRMAEVYRLVASHWPHGTRNPAASFNAHRILMYHPDRFTLMRKKALTSAEAKELAGRKV